MFHSSTSFDDGKGHGEHEEIPEHIELETNLDVFDPVNSKAFLMRYTIATTSLSSIKEYDGINTEYSDYIDVRWALARMQEVKKEKLPRKENKVWTNGSLFVMLKHFKLPDKRYVQSKSGIELPNAEKPFNKEDVDKDLFRAQSRDEREEIKTRANDCGEPSGIGNHVEKTQENVYGVETITAEGDIKDVKKGTRTITMGIHYLRREFLIRTGS